ncbi:MAG: DUF3574 domain-containing protein [Usitatibacter sp.]
MPRIPALVAVAAFLAGCATTSAPPPSRCAADEHEAISDLLYFGTSKPGGSVSQKDWSDFLLDVVTPRFPKGFTAWQAQGQWKPERGETQREVSYVVSIAHPAGGGADADIRTVIEKYKGRFQQESVLRVSSLACISY